MTRRFRLRLAAALLAWTGLLALPLRALEACPMRAAPADAASAHAAHAVHAGHDAGVKEADAHDHAQHEAPPSDDATSPPPAGDAPSHEGCPDMAHCSIAVVQSGDAIVLRESRPLGLPLPSPRTSEGAVARGVEPPPPKA